METATEKQIIGEQAEPNTVAPANQEATSEAGARSGSGRSGSGSGRSSSSRSGSGRSGSERSGSSRSGSGRSTSGRSGSGSGRSGSSRSGSGRSGSGRTKRPPTAGDKIQKAYKDFKANQCEAIKAWFFSDTASAALAWMGIVLGCAAFLAWFFISSQYGAPAAPAYAGF